MACLFSVCFCELDYTLSMDFAEFFVLALHEIQSL